MNPITLSPEMKELKLALEKDIETVEARLKISIEVNNGQMLYEELSSRLELLNMTARMMMNATKIYDFAKGEAAELALLEHTILEAKQSILKLWIDGKLQPYNALYVHAERCQKNLDLSIEGIRSLLSYEKQLAFQNRG